MAQVARGSAASVVGRVTGLTAIAVLLAYWFLQPVPLGLKGLAAVLVVVSIAAPASGLVVFAGLAPLSTAIASLCGAPGMGAQLLEQMALGIGAGVIARNEAAGVRTRIGAPALLMATVAIASAAAMVPAAAAQIARGIGDAGPVLHQLALRQTALASVVWAPLFAALVVAECGLLGWAVERTLRSRPPLAARLVAIALIGHAGAGLLNFQAVLSAALRGGRVFEALPHLLMTARVSMQADWNAGASALLLAGVAGLGLMNVPGFRRVAAGLLLAIVALGLWITGSRIAIAMGVIAIGAVIGRLAAKAGWRGRLIAMGIVLVVLGVGAWQLIGNPAGRNDPISRSVSIRKTMAAAGLQMFKEAPVFGIGITKFYGASAAFIGPFMKSVGGGPRENAHNNFIQVLAEQGVLGFSAMLWWLGVVLVSGVRAQMSKPGAIRGSVTLAVTACVGTWMTGHPLLVPEFAFVFWLFGGVVTSLTPSVAPTRPRWYLRVLVAGVLLSVPFRAYGLRNAANLEHLGFGLSMWQHDDAQRYREAGTSFAIYLPSTGRRVEVPVRRAPGAPDAVVLDVTIQGRLVDRVPISGETWQTVLVVLPPGSRQFELVDFLVRPVIPGTNATRVLLRVGKAVAR